MGRYRRGEWIPKNNSYDYNFIQEEGQHHLEYQFYYDDNQNRAFSTPRYCVCHIRCDDLILHLFSLGDDAKYWTETGGTCVDDEKNKVSHYYKRISKTDQGALLADMGHRAIPILCHADSSLQY